MPDLLPVDTRPRGFVPAPITDEGTALDTIWGGELTDLTRMRNYLDTEHGG